MHDIAGRLAQEPCRTAKAQAVCSPIAIVMRTSCIYNTLLFRRVFPQRSHHTTALFSSMSAHAPFDNDVDHLYRNHYSWLQNLLRRKVGCSFKAADLAQDTFVRILADNVREPLQPLRQPRAFLATIAGRILANHWRRQHIEQAYLDALSARPEPVAISAEEHAIIIETLLEVDRRLSSLPATVRRAFVLTQVEGHSLADAAGILDVSVATIKRHVIRAGMRCYFAQ